MAVWNPRANAIFASVLELPPLQRQASLERACGADGALRRQVEALLAAHAEAGSFLDQPVLGAAHPGVLDLPTTGPDSGPPLPAGGSVIQALAADLPSVPRVHLRDPYEEALTPVARPGSENMPGNQDFSGRLQLHGEIARGGMGAVLKGRDIDLGRDVAVKVLLETHQGKTELVQRFVEEAQIAGQLQHPGIAPVYELGQFADQRPYFTMKLVKGKTLAALLAARKELAEDQSKFVGVFAQVCQTLAYAHARGVIHRDLKPANVMVGAFGEVQVMDWGLAKVLAEGGVADEQKAQQHHTVSVIRTQRSLGSSGLEGIGSHTVAGSMLGTPAYMSPEQARGEVELIDKWADVFGLGAILCEILTGQPPYTGKKAEVQRKAQTASLDDAYARLDGSGADAELVGLAKRCLAAEPWERPRDAGQVAEAVTAYQSSVAERLRRAELAQAAEAARAEEAQATAEQERLAREAAQARAAAERRAQRLLLGLAASVLLSVVLGSGVWLWLAGQAAKTTRQIQDTLAQAVELREQALATQDQTKWNEARDLARRAATLLENGPTDPELGDRVRALVRKLDDESNDRRLLVRLDEIQLAQADDDVWMSGFADKQVLQDYAQAFAAHGLNMAEMSVEEAVRWIGQRPERVREALVAVLDDWLDLARWHKAPEVGRLARVVDDADRDDPWRQELRLALAGNDLTELNRLAESKGFSRQRPQTVLLLARHLVPKYPKHTIELLRTAQQRFPADFWINYKLSQFLMLQGDDDGTRFAMAAIASRPDNAQAWVLLALQLRGQERQDERIAAGRRAVALAPHLAGPYTALGNALRAKGQIADAAAAYRQAIALQPLGWTYQTLGILLWQEGQTHDEAIAVLRKAAQDSLGLALFEKGRFHEAADVYGKAVKHFADNTQRARGAKLGLLVSTGRANEAIDRCRKAIVTQPDDPLSYLSLAWGLHVQGQYEESLAAYRRCQELLLKHHSYLRGIPLARWIREAERMKAIDRQWREYAEGKLKPRDRSERRLLTLHCVIREQYLAAARLHLDGLRDDAHWAEDLDAEARYDAARYAALVAAGKGEGASQLTEQERNTWQKRAVHWLQAELRRQTKHLENAPSRDRSIALDRLRWWQQEPDLAAIRDPDALAKLLAEEQQACRELWAAVEALLRKAGEKPK
jgi:tetratricopeptide (TPR) repeat protein/tRNA A-37 threonylcarbamoyl transferase component Bud32